MDSRLVFLRPLGLRLRVCPSCGKGYHVSFEPPRTSGVCDVCGTVLVQRSDDVEETVIRRLDVYAQQTQPLIDYYAASGGLSILSGVGSIDEICERKVGS